MTLQASLGEHAGGYHGACPRINPAHDPADAATAFGACRIKAEALQGRHPHARFCRSPPPHGRQPDPNGGCHASPLLVAIEELPREVFLPRPRSLSPIAISISWSGKSKPQGEKRWSLAPVLLARMLQAVEPVRGAKVLHVGCGTGYASGIFARLGAHVVALDEDASLIAAAERALATAGVRGVKTFVGPLDAGAPANSPFDVILSRAPTNANRKASSRNWARVGA